MKLTNLSDHYLYYALRIGDHTFSDVSLRPGKTIEITAEHDELIIR